MPRKPSYVGGGAGAAASGGRPRPATRTLHIAVQGCCHGELDKIYAECKRHEENWGKKIDFLLCCGDFQSIREESDLDSMAVPIKYRTMGDFHRYCCDPAEVAAETTPAAGPSPHQPQTDTSGSGKTMAPYLTIFIGGNHEASNVLFQNYYGGYIAPNVYYVGHSGVIDVMGLRLAGLSGIWKRFDSHRPYPSPPYDGNTVRSAYHVRAYEVEKLSLFGALAARERRRAQQQQQSTATAATSSAATEETADATVAEGQPSSSSAASSSSTAVLSEADTRPIDIILSHDWPVGITKYGDEAQLLRYKPYFGPDIEKGELGNPLTMGLLTELRPRYWCSAHLHCSFSASVPHSETARTQFIALDKCVRDKSFLDFIDITVPIPEGEAAAAPPAAAAPVSFSSLRPPRPAVASEPPKITIPPLWQEVLRVAQPALAESHARGHLALFAGRGQNEGRVPPAEAEAVALRSPMPPPVTVTFGMNVGQALAASGSSTAVVVGGHGGASQAAKRPREASLEGSVVAPAGAVAAEGASVTAAVPPTPAAGGAEAVDDWLIEG